GKDLIYGATLHDGLGVLLTAAAVLTNILLLYAGFLAGIKPFSGELPEAFKNVHLPDMRLWVPPLLLAVLGVIYGILPSLTDASLMQHVVQSLSPGAVTAPLKVWHGINPVLLLSGLTLAGGIGLYYYRQPAHFRLQSMRRYDPFSPETLVLKSAGKFDDFSHWYTNKLHSGNLRSYVYIIVIFMS